MSAPSTTAEMRVHPGILGPALVVNMALLTVAGPSFGILASTLIDTFGISRSQVGLLAAGYAFVGAVISPFTGRLADRIGGRNMMTLGFAVSALVFVTLGLANGFAVLLLGGVLSGIPNGMANQGTNKYITAEVSVERRGIITGIKQSGVTFGVFLGGALLPLGARGLGYRPTMLIVAGIAIVVGLTVRLVLPLDRRTGGAGPGSRGPLPPAITWLAVYAALMGAAVGSLSAFTALYAEEVIGWSRESAGLLVGFGGLVAVVARVLLGRLTQTVPSYAPVLFAMAVGGVGVFVLMRLASVTGGWILVLSTALSGFTTGSWNAPVNLASMRLVPPSDVGRSVGRIMFGFMAGYGLGPPVFGFAVDRLGSYGLPWLGSAALSAAAALLMLQWRHSER